MDETVIHCGYEKGCSCCSGMDEVGRTICGLDLNCWEPYFGSGKRITLNKKKVTCKNCLRRLGRVKV